MWDNIGTFVGPLLGWLTAVGVAEQVFGEATVSAVMKALTCTLKRWVCGVLDFMIESADETFLAPVQEMIPEAPQDWDFSVFAGAWTTLDTVLPVSEGLGLAAAYMVMLCTVLVYVAIKKHIPGLA